ncbi:MAG: DegT/DnrJ/EryC1/StrS family aminotransferase [Sphingobacteriales bacterium]|nr:MAG: DegT/DnrJ/EryC1/StrS family aminotransferase [Sphingobacteriales bacterium]
MINVTKPFLPPIEDYQAYIKDIWQRNWVTNNGPLVNELELKLKEYLKLKHMLFLSNGTIAIQIAIKALELRGEIITTPFSYVATTSSIIWEGCTPIYVDIDPLTFNIDPSKIEAAITSHTSAILATHVYGNPCDIDAINVLARKHNLKVIYDAAHCFGTTYKGKSVFEYGDITTTSFHATKIYHSIEGGAVFTNDPELLKKMSFLRNFGHNGPDVFTEVGINGKNSEMHAAMGLCILNYIDAIMDKRKNQWLHYKEILKGLNVQSLALYDANGFNYAYYPIVFSDEEQLLKSVNSLNLNLISPRRYFYPTLNKLPYNKNAAECSVAEALSPRVLCLPLYDSLAVSEQNMIARILLRVQNN